MRKILSVVLLALAFSCMALAQGGSDYPPPSQLRGDYNLVGMVVHVKVRSIRFAAPGVHPLYKLRGEVVETFKGRARRGQPFDFYMAVEEDFDVNTRLGDWVVFLEGSSDTPDKKWGWFTLENSSLPYSKGLASSLRAIKSMKARGRSGRPRAGPSGSRVGRRSPKRLRQVP